MLVVAALLAFAPVATIDLFLDNYVKSRETQRLQTLAAVITDDTQASVREGIAALGRIVEASPSLCAATFQTQVATELAANPYLREVVVENTDGVQYCSAFADAVYRVGSESLSIPGSSHTLAVVTMDGTDAPLLRITQRVGGERIISAIVLAAPLLTRGIDSLLGESGSVQLALTNGTPIAESGAPHASDRGDHILARSFAGDMPVKAEAILAFGPVRAQYAQLDVTLTIAACILGGVILIMAIQYGRRANLGPFDLERAIMAGEMKPYYQPVINLRTGKLAGCEVLIRWIKKNGEVVPPGAFIDYAEMSGLAIPMTLSLMEQVRDDLAVICREVSDFKVSINLFEGHFRDGSIVEDIQSVFEGSGISYRQLVFEITERRPLDDRSAANRVMTAMHKLGVRIAMDDAGTGHSNLAYLQTLGIDIIKIDRIFVEMIKHPTDPVPVIDGLISMGRELGIEIVAEGVETQEQALYLRSKGISLAQGYLFAAPMAVRPFLTLANALKPQPRRSHLPDLAA